MLFIADENIEKMDLDNTTHRFSQINIWGYRSVVSGMSAERLIKEVNKKMRGLARPFVGKG